MESLIIQKKDDIVMRLVHYFITEKNYSPIVVHGVKDEVWLENNEGPYKIIRINSNYIHNEEQFNLDIFKTKNVMRQIKKKTLSFKMNALNIFLDVNDGVELKEVKDIDSVVINSLKDLTNDEFTEIFPDIKDKILLDEKGLELVFNITNDINKKNEEENRIYEKTFSPKKTIITNLIITACIIIYLFLGMQNHDFFSIKAKVLFDYGANYKPAILNMELYRLITCTFLHASIMHLLFNMYALFVIGNQLETYLGKKKFLIVYIVSAISGSLLSCILTNSVSVGASGAIFGLLGSLLYFGYHYRLYLNTVIRSQIIPLIILNLAIGFMDSSIDNWAHIGGLVGGYLSTMALGIEGKSTKSERVNGTIVLCLFIGFMIYILFR